MISQAILIKSTYSSTLEPDRPGFRNNEGLFLLSNVKPIMDVILAFQKKEEHSSLVCIN